MFRVNKTGQQVVVLGFLAQNVEIHFSAGQVVELAQANAHIFLKLGFCDAGGLKVQLIEEFARKEGLHCIQWWYGGAWAEGDG